MQIDFYFIAKILLILFTWTLLILFALFILNSGKLYFALKEIEENCKQKRRTVARNILPIVYDLAEKNNFLKSVLNLNGSNFKELVLSIVLIFFQGFFFAQWIKAGFRLTNKVLR